MSTRITLTGITKRFAPVGSGAPAGAGKGGATRAGGAGGMAGTPTGGAQGIAVDHVSLEIEPGELFFLLGPSGCGKTTLLRMIAGFIEPTAGTIEFAVPGPAGGITRRDVTYLPPNKRNTGMVFQSYALWPHMSVEANVAFGLTIRKVGAEERRRRVMEALELVRMGEYAQRRPTQLSGGQQQRVALARALVVRPDVLLLDEPLSNLDAKLRIELRSEIRRICKDPQGVRRVDGGATNGVGSSGVAKRFTDASAAMTTIYVTHDQKEALSMADRVAIMRAGKVEQIGTPGELYRKPRSRFVAEFLGETNFVEGVVKEARGAGSRVVLDTPAGALAAQTDRTVTTGERVLCSVRPESIVVKPAGGGPGSSGENRLRGRVVESVYLGEVMQHTIEVGGTSVRLKATTLNPVAMGSASSGGGLRDVEMEIAPSDVVIVEG